MYKFHNAQCQYLVHALHTKNQCVPQVLHRATSIFNAHTAHQYSKCTISSAPHDKNIQCTYYTPIFCMHHKLCITQCQYWMRIPHTNIPRAPYILHGTKPIFNAHTTQKYFSWTTISTPCNVNAQRSYHTLILWTHHKFYTTHSQYLAYKSLFFTSLIFYISSFDYRDHCENVRLTYLCQIQSLGSQNNPLKQLF